MKKFNNFLFEYSILIIFITFSIIDNYILNNLTDGFSFVLITLVIYYRHYHIGEELDVVYKKHYTIVKRLNKAKHFYLLDIPTFLMIFLFLNNREKFIINLVLFIIWFVISDIFRQRYSLYGTYISRWFYTSKIEINNTKWVIHKNDNDPFPSVPHMHSIEYPLKLNIYTGEIININSKKIVCIANKKELKKLWKDKKFIEIVKHARKNYILNNPKSLLPDYRHFIQ